MVQVMEFVLALLLIVNPFNSAKAATINEVLSKIQAFYQKIHTLKATFTQKTYFFNGKVKVYKGVVWIKKPFKFRWEYTKPERFVIVSDGKKIIVYYPEEKQAFVYSATRAISSQVALAFVTGKGNIKKELKLSSFKVLAPGIWKLTFYPSHPDPQVEKISLVVNLKTGEVKRFCVVNTAGQKVVVIFKKVYYNLPVSSKLFLLRLPKDVELINSF